MRFQPRLGRILAAASENFVSLLDVETQVCRRKLQVSLTGIQLFTACQARGKLEDPPQFHYLLTRSLMLFHLYHCNIGMVQAQSKLFIYLYSCFLELSYQGHKSQVHAVCWDPHGEYLASVSEDSVRVWNVGSGGSKGELIHELSSTGNHYRTCVFHPSHPSLLVVGCCEVSYDLHAIIQLTETWKCHH